MNEQLIDQIMKEVLQKIGGEDDHPGVSPSLGKRDAGATVVARGDYPLSEKRPELVTSPTGKKLDHFTLERVLNGDLTREDVRISSETLELQAQIAESMGRDPLARNFRRAAELIAVPDDRILEIYNALRPYRSTKEELLEIADELENRYHAAINASLVREAVAIYEKRDRLKKN
ncbi:diol dehydratase small subunit [Bacillus piscicola]|uniref:diol dehydratase small subunit n=1 Tax=Bacillus piscicola TaxID=1632684 RepID=UPI001F09BABB